jgi:hypothetical protein
MDTKKAGTIYMMDHNGTLRGAIMATVYSFGPGALVLDKDTGCVYRVVSVRRAGAEIHFEGRRVAA